MSSISIRSRKSNRLSRGYRVALYRYLASGPAGGLQPAVRLGRQALALGLETLDLAAMHEQALMGRGLPGGAATVRNRLVQRAAEFFARAILPLEETHRSAQEANARLRRVNQALQQRGVELAASNRELRKEIVRRQRFEERLRQSEERSRHLLKRSRDFQEQLRHLSRQVLLAQEEERRKISRELQDVIAQVLTGINVQLAALKTEAKVNTRGLNQKISRTQRRLERSVSILHRFARELRPAVLDDLGLLPALHSYLRGFAKETGLRVSLTAFAGVEALDNTRRTVLYRVAQEALTNVARHAQASRVNLSLERLARGVRLQVRDDGKSFEVERALHARQTRRLGLLGMRERVEMVGGQLTIESAPGQGTTIRAQIPFGRGSKVETHPGSGTGPSNPWASSGGRTIAERRRGEASKVQEAQLTTRL